MKTNARVNTLCFIVFFLSGRRSLPRRSGSTEARARTHHHRGRKWPHHPCHPVGCKPSSGAGSPIRLRLHKRVVDKRRAQARGGRADL